MVKSEYHSGLDHDPIVMESLELLSELGYLVESLIGRDQIFLGDALDPDEQGGTAALCRKFQQLRIPGHGQACLASPVYLQRDQRLKELFCVCLIACDIIIHKHDIPCV